MFARSFDLEVQEFAFALKEPRPKPAYFVRWKNEASKAEDRTVVVLWMVSADVRADVPKLVEIGNVRQRFDPKGQKHESPRKAWASERGQP